MSEYNLHKYYKPNFLRFFGVLCLVLAIFMVYEVVKHEKSFPEYDELVYSEGNLTLEAPPNKHATGVYFSFSSSEKKFAYTSKSAAMKKVRESINKGTVAKVGYYQNEKNNNGFKNVYDLEIDGKKNQVL